MQNLLKAFACLLLLSNCCSENKEKTVRQIYYFDLQSYFNEQAKMLNKTAKKINKTVAKNEITEQKLIRIINWETELALFINADINKPAWKDSYTKDSTATKVIYTATDKDLRTQKIEINLNHGKATQFVIDTQEDNLLYHSTEHLEYIPGVLYLIKKHQKVFLLGLNNYEIKGQF